MKIVVVLGVSNRAQLAYRCHLSQFLIWTLSAVKLLLHYLSFSENVGRLCESHNATFILWKIENHLKCMCFEGCRGWGWVGALNFMYDEYIYFCPVNESLYHDNTAKHPTKYLTMYKFSGSTDNGTKPFYHECSRIYPRHQDGKFIAI